MRMANEEDLRNFSNPTIKNTLDAISKNNDLVSRMVGSQGILQSYIYEIKANQAILDMARITNPIVDMEATNALKHSLELAAKFESAATELAQKTDILNNAYETTHQSILKSLKAWEAANQYLINLIPKFDFGNILNLPASYPPNWISDIDLTILEEILFHDGIPVVWIPNSELLERIVYAHDRKARVSVLMEESDVLFKDCIRIIDESQHESLGKIKPLAKTSIAAWKEYPEAAQALAVVVTDALIQKWLPSITTMSHYSDIREIVKQPLSEIAIVNVRQSLALAVIYRFYTEFDVNKPETAPSELSRHVTVHSATTDHLHRGNSLIAIMVMSSLIRTFNDLI